MRALDPEFAEKLAGGATTLCRCWQVVRRDGVVMGFTDHDVDLTFDGVRHAAATGLTAGALEAVTGLAVDSGAVAGAVRSDAIREADIAAGAYDGARVSGWLVDWQRPEHRIQRFAGHIGEITRGTVAFEAELLSLSDQLNRPVGRAILKRCDAVLGDARCGVDLDQPAFRGSGQVVAVLPTGRIEVSGLDSYADAWFDGGSLVWSSGANAGRSGIVKRDIGSAPKVLELWIAPAAEIAVGDAFDVRAGCDKSTETCITRFDNYENFRGFPHVPGEDWGLAYPKEGEVHDGGSLNRGEG
ncbi:MAG: DUF2163 domain-containing protein [Pseudomonadota bacterium]